LLHPFLQVKLLNHNLIMNHLKLYRILMQFDEHPSRLNCLILLYHIEFRHDVNHRHELVLLSLHNHLQLIPLLSYPYYLPSFSCAYKILTRILPTASTTAPQTGNHSLALSPVLGKLLVDSILGIDNSECFFTFLLLTFTLAYSLG